MHAQTRCARPRSNSDLNASISRKPLIETYQLPPSFGSVSRDQEFVRAGELGSELKRELLASDALIVICSPDAARSKWVNYEIAEFIAKKGRGSVFTVLARGEPRFDGPSAAFPPALNPDRRRWFRKADAYAPLAVQYRPDNIGDVLTALVAAVYELDRRVIRNAAALRDESVRAERARIIGAFAGECSQLHTASGDMEMASLIALQAACLIDSDPGSPLRNCLEAILPRKPLQTFLCPI